MLNNVSDPIRSMELYITIFMMSLLVVVEKSLALEQLQQAMSEGDGTIAELTSKLEQVEGEKNKLNTENEELAKRM